MIALALDQEEDFFDSAVEYPGVFSRMLHYPPQPVEGQEIPGQAAHTVRSCPDYLEKSLMCEGLGVLHNPGARPCPSSAGSQ
jgi:hydroxyacylglutathione hydrolase